MIPSDFKKTRVIGVAKQGSRIIARHATTSNHLRFWTMIVATTSTKGSFWTGVLCGAVLSTITWAWLSISTSGNEKRLKKNGEVSLSKAIGSRFLRGTMNRNSSFLTDIMEQLWVYMKVAGAETIRASLEPSFAELPGPMNTCRFTKLDLGDVPIRMDNITVHPLQPDGSVQFDMDIEWDGECNFQLKADYIGAFGIKHLKLSGRMAIVLKPLTNDLPLVAGIQYSFINMPTIDLSFTGLASVAELSLLESTVREAIQSSLSTSVLPYRRLYKMNKANNFLDTYQPPIGVLRSLVKEGQGFVIEKRFLAKDDVPDVYLKVSLGALPETWRTLTIRDNLNPQWNEGGDFCLYDREQMIQIHAWDEDGGPLDPDDDLGVAKVTVADLLLSPCRTITLPFKMFNRSERLEKKTGASITLSCDICEWTNDLSSLNANPISMGVTHNQICGLLVVIVSRAFDLPLDRKTACTFVKVRYAEKEYDSKMIYEYPGWDPLNPVYDKGVTIPITADMPRDENAQVYLDLISIADQKSTIVGCIDVAFSTLRDLPDNTLTERRSIGLDGAWLEYRVSLSGVSPSPANSRNTTPRSSPVKPGTSAYPRSLPLSPPKTNGNSVRFDLDEEPSVGTFRLTVVKARGLKIREELFAFDVPDVYFKVQSAGQTFRTSVKHNNITPAWNEANDWNLVDHDQVFVIKGWDRNERDEDPDVAIGTAKTTASKLLLSGGNVELELLNDKGMLTGVFVTLDGQIV